jgi:hypothetical protein
VAVLAVTSPLGAHGRRTASAAGLIDALFGAARWAAERERLAYDGWLAQNHPVKFEILGEIEHAETIAVGTGVRVGALLNKAHGRGRWRKRKGFARVPAGGSGSTG